MNVIEGNNITDTFYKAINMMEKKGIKTVPGVLELSPVLIHIKNPTERCLVIPNRNNNGIQSIAETIWVLGGREDLKYLKKYLPRAEQFSDDGRTWRGAYGKRIFRWHSEINQIKNVVSILRNNKYSTRGVIVLIDPSRDISLHHKDVPCNNWIQFSIRENKLNMYVTLRANDLFWGFSGINFFEWSVLQEMVAYWLGVEVGEYYHFVGYMSIFKRHFQTCKKIKENKIEKDIYQHKIPKITVDIKEEIFEKELKHFFKIEERFENISNVEDIELVSIEIKKLESNFLKQSAYIMLSYILFENGYMNLFKRTFELIEESDFKVMVTSYFQRKCDNNAEEDIEIVLNKYKELEIYNY